MFDPNSFPDPVVLPENEELDEFHFENLTITRVWVPGGWLLVSSLVGPSEDGGSPTVAITSTFISDPNHEWVGEDLGEDS